MSERNIPGGDAETIRLNVSARTTAANLLYIGWMGGMLVFVLVSVLGTWWAWLVAAAINFLGAAWGMRVSRAHTFHAAIIGAAMATSEIERRKHG